MDPCHHEPGGQQTLNITVGVSSTVDCPIDGGDHEKGKRNKPAVLHQASLRGPLSTVYLHNFLGLAQKSNR